MSMWPQARFAGRRQQSQGAPALHVVTAARQQMGQAERRLEHHVRHRQGERARRFIEFALQRERTRRPEA
jgi:hypothetical protein